MRSYYTAHCKFNFNINLFTFIPTSSTILHGNIVSLHWHRFTTPVKTLSTSSSSHHEAKNEYFRVWMAFALNVMVFVSINFNILSTSTNPKPPATLHVILINSRTFPFVRRCTCLNETELLQNFRLLGRLTGEPRIDLLSSLFDALHTNRVLATSDTVASICVAHFSTVWMTCERYRYTLR